MSRGKETGARLGTRRVKKSLQTETIQCYLWKEPCRVTQLVRRDQDRSGQSHSDRRDPLRKSTGEREGSKGRKRSRIPAKQESLGLPDSRYQVAGSRGRSSSSSFGGRRWHSGRSGRDTWVPLNPPSASSCFYFRCSGSRGVPGAPGNQ